MKVGMIDVDWRHRQKMTFPNLSLMKLSAWHKRQGDDVIWYDTPITSGHVDKCYVSKVFSDTYTPDIDFTPDADEIVRGGSGYAIDLKDGHEQYHKERDSELPYEIEHIMPDYSLYGITDTAYGFLSRGCPRGCPFCIVADKEGRFSHKVADLREWWDGQKRIVLMDPNILACPDWEDLLGQLAGSGAEIDINQGADVRLLTPDKAEALSRLKMKRIHFAWDGTDDLEPMFRAAAEPFGKMIRAHRVSVYVLTNYNTDMDWNLHRIYTLRDLGYDPYVMVYDKEHAPHEIRRLQRWCNNKIVFKKCKDFKEYKP